MTSSRGSVVAAAVLLAVLAGCGDEQPAAAPDVVVPTQTPDELQQEANRVYQSFAGTQEQNDAIGVLKAWQLNGAMARCMDDAGYPEWSWSITRTVAVVDDGLAVSEVFEAPHRLGFAISAIGTRETAEREQQLMADEPTGGYADAIDACAADKGKGPANDVDLKPVKELRNEWWTLMSELDQRYGGGLDLEGCIAAGEPAVIDPHDGNSFDIQLSVNYGIRPSDIPDTVDDPNASDAWKRAVALEQEYADLSWDCRKDVYEAHSDEALADVLAWEQRHAGEIEQLAAVWDDALAAAERLGYDPVTHTVDEESAS